MQSVIKLSEASTIHKLSNHENVEKAADSDRSADIAKLPAVTVLSNKERVAFGNSRSAEASGDDEHAVGEPAAASSGGDDALAWLKIIQNATADLTADIRASKEDAFARSPKEPASFERNPPSPSADFAGRQRDFHDDSQHDVFSDERKLAQRLSYRYAEPRSLTPQTLRAAVMPYIAATGLFAFLAGSAAVYFVIGPSSQDVKARASAPAAETLADAPLAREDQPSPKKGGLQRAASPAPSAEDGSSWGSRAEEPRARSAEPGVDRQPQSWADTVETFKQFVRPEQK